MANSSRLPPHRGLRGRLDQLRTTGCRTQRGDGPGQLTDDSSEVRDLLPRAGTGALPDARLIAPTAGASYFLMSTRIVRLQLPSDA
jgi:hypothetical protein